MVLPRLQPCVAHHLVEGYFSSREASSPAMPLFRETPRPTNIHTGGNKPPWGAQELPALGECVFRSRVDSL